MEHIIIAPTASSAKAPNKKFSLLPTQEKAENIVQFLKEHKAQAPVMLNITDFSSCTDLLIIVTASSLRHAKALADGALSFARENNYEFSRMEGYDTAQWILLDMNDILVNIFLGEARELYKLEVLWPEGILLLDERA